MIVMLYSLSVPKGEKKKLDTTVVWKEAKQASIPNWSSSTAFGFGIFFG